MDDFIIEYTNENIREILDNKEKYYLEKIKLPNIYINNINIGWKSYPLIDKYDGTFFHLASKGYKDQDLSCCPNLVIQCPKIFDYNPMMSDDYNDNQKRAICPHKIQCMNHLENFFNNDDLLIWSRRETTKKGKRTRIKILDRNNKYIVILEVKPNGTILFWTGYPIDFNYKIKKFENEYNKYINQGGETYHTYYK
ncbi:hypothetical protein [Faecalibacillus intestinalis]|uniref:hypothetical protein n=1 Tax=Faecalibacillus intestinalis TaxID=1982626 RepID=UPI003AB1AABF